MGYRLDENGNIIFTEKEEKIDLYKEIELLKESNEDLKKRVKKLENKGDANAKR